MKQLNLKAENPSQELVKNYLEQNVSDLLAEKINNGKKTLQGCWNFIVGEAKKKAVSGCACIEDKEVFGWAVHYFEEDSIAECKSAPAVKTATTKTEAKAEKKPAPEAKPKAEKKAPPKNVDEDQISVFDLLG